MPTGATLGAALALGLLAVVRWGPGPPVVLACGYVAAVTLPLCVADLRERRLPNVLVLPGFVFAATGVVGRALARGSPPLAEVVLCSAVVATFAVVAASEGMGMGDVKLAGMLALAATSAGLGAERIAAAAGVAFLGAGVVALGVLHTGGREVPLGPFLLLGFWAAVGVR